MERKKASDFHPEVLHLFDRYVHGLIDRRAFLTRAAKFAVGTMSASMLLDALNPRFAEAQQVAKDDSRLKASTAEFGSPKGSGQMRGYLALPAKAQGKLPGILVIHENRGLNPHIEDVARRIALENYVAFAPDALTPLGGYPGDEDKARELLAKLDQAKTREDFLAALTFLEKRPECSGKVGTVGFCYGGGMVNSSPPARRSWPRACPSTAASRRRRTWRRSRPRSSSTTRRRTTASTPVSLPSSRRSRPTR
jgi:carboxymethylenebutenolidase